jgi:hypothetical protein
MGMKLGLTLRERLKLRGFRKRVLRGVFGLERNDVTIDFRKLRIEELHNFYCPTNIIWAIR